LEFEMVQNLEVHSGPTIELKKNYHGCTCDESSGKPWVGDFWRQSSPEHLQLSRTSVKEGALT
jgi:hypothetical protein